MASILNNKAAVGIDDMSAYIPKLYLPIEALADKRQLEYAKLNKGLGLTAMSFPDAHEDVATMAANAILDLILRNGIIPSRIGRIYIGTESSLDGSKPMASYVLDMLTQYFSKQYGPDCFLNCDVVDMTFACIGAVDALQNTLDWVRGGDGRIEMRIEFVHRPAKRGGNGGARRDAERLGVPFLGEVPLTMNIRERSDSGEPVVASEPDGPQAAIYREIAARVLARLKEETAAAEAATPAIVFE